MEDLKRFVEEKGEEMTDVKYFGVYEKLRKDGKAEGKTEKEVAVYGDKEELFLTFLKDFIPKKYKVFNTENDGPFPEKLEGYYDKMNMVTEIGRIGGRCWYGSYANKETMAPTGSKIYSYYTIGVYEFGEVVAIEYSCHDSFAHSEIDFILPVS